MNNGFPGMSFMEWTYDEESKMYVATNISSEGVYFDMGGVSAPLNYEYVKIAFEDGKLARIGLKKANDYDCTILYKDYGTTEITEIFE